MGAGMRVVHVVVLMLVCDGSLAAAVPATVVRDLRHHNRPTDVANRETIVAAEVGNIHFKAFYNGFLHTLVLFIIPLEEIGSFISAFFNLLEQTPFFPDSITVAMRDASRSYWAGYAKDGCMNDFDITEPIQLKSLDVSSEEAAATTGEHPDDPPPPMPGFSDTPPPKPWDGWTTCDTPGKKGGIDNCDKTAIQTGCAKTCGFCADYILGHTDSWVPTYDEYCMQYLTMIQSFALMSLLMGIMGLVTSAMQDTAIFKTFKKMHHAKTQIFNKVILRSYARKYHEDRGDYDTTKKYADQKAEKAAMSDEDKRLEQDKKQRLAAQKHEDEESDFEEQAPEDKDDLKQAAEDADKICATGDDDCEEVKTKAKKKLTASSDPTGILNFIKTIKALLRSLIKKDKVPHLDNLGHPVSRLKDLDRTITLRNGNGADMMDPSANNIMDGSMELDEVLLALKGTNSMFGKKGQGAADAMLEALREGKISVDDYLDDLQELTPWTLLYVCHLLDAQFYWLHAKVAAAGPLENARHFNKRLSAERKFRGQLVSCYEKAATGETTDKDVVAFTAWIRDNMCPMTSVQKDTFKQINDRVLATPSESNGVVTIPNLGDCDKSTEDPKSPGGKFLASLPTFLETLQVIGPARAKAHELAAKFFELAQAYEHRLTNLPYITLPSLNEAGPADITLRDDCAQAYKSILNMLPKAKSAKDQCQDKSHCKWLKNPNKDGVQCVVSGEEADMRKFEDLPVASLRKCEEFTVNATRSLHSEFDTAALKQQEIVRLMHDYTDMLITWEKYARLDPKKKKKFKPKMLDKIEVHAEFWSFEEITARALKMNQAEIRQSPTLAEMKVAHEKAADSVDTGSEDAPGLKYNDVLDSEDRINDMENFLLGSPTWKLAVYHSVQAADSLDYSTTTTYVFKSKMMEDRNLGIIPREEKSVGMLLTQSMLTAQRRIHSIFYWMTYTFIQALFALLAVASILTLYYTDTLGRQSMLTPCHLRNPNAVIQELNIYSGLACPLFGDSTFMDWDPRYPSTDVVGDLVAYRCWDGSTPDEPLRQVEPDGYTDAYINGTMPVCPPPPLTQDPVSTKTHSGLLLEMGCGPLSSFHTAKCPFHKRAGALAQTHAIAALMVEAPNHAQQMCMVMSGCIAYTYAPGNDTLAVNATTASSNDTEWVSDASNTTDWPRLVTFYNVTTPRLSRGEWAGWTTHVATCTTAGYRLTDTGEATSQLVFNPEATQLVVVSASYGLCSADVTKSVNDRCGLRERCDLWVVPNAFEGLPPCPSGGALQATYGCMGRIEVGIRSHRPWPWQENIKNSRSFPMTKPGQTSLFDQAKTAAAAAAGAAKAAAKIGHAAGRDAMAAAREQAQQVARDAEGLTPTPTPTPSPAPRRRLRPWPAQARQG